MWMEEYKHTSVNSPPKRNKLRNALLSLRLGELDIGNYAIVPLAWDASPCKVSSLLGITSL